jgi:hypothetical protein
MVNVNGQPFIVSAAECSSQLNLIKLLKSVGFIVRLMYAEAYMKSLHEFMRHH